MPVTLKIHHKGLLIVAVPLVIGTVFLLFLYSLLMQSEGEARDEAHSNDVLHSIFILGKELFSGINALTAYSYLKNPAMDQKYLDSRAHIVKEFQTLRVTLKDHPKELEQLVKTERFEMRALKICDGMYDAFHEEDTDLITLMNIRGLRTQMEALVEQTITELKALNEVVETQSGSRSAGALKWRQTAKVLLLWGVGLNIFLSVIVVLYFSRAITDRLKVLMSNATRIALGQPLLPVIKGVDEIAELDRVIHNMAAAIDESNKRQKALVDNAVDVICSIDKENVFRMVSNASERVWGYPDSELVGKRLTDIILPDDIDETLNCLATIKKVESTVPVENRVRCKDGQIINVLWSVYWSEQEETLYCVAHDITARKMVEKLLKESEERTRSIMAGLPVGLVVINQAGTMQLANNKTQEMFGLKQPELVGRNLSRLFRRDGSSDVQTNEWMEELLSSASGHVLELTAVRPSGSEFPVELSSSEVKVGEKQLHLVAMLDVTERHEIERLKREFVAMVSHDLKTPLSSVRGMLVLLSHGAAGQLPDKAKPIVESAENQLERLIKLINDLLDVQRMESGKFNIDATEVNMRTILEQSLDAVERYADESKVEVVIEGPDEQVFADPDRLVQVVVNLLSNAIKFSPADSRVVMGIERDGDFVTVKVKDEGRGISREFQESIFERFKQVKNSDATVKKGSGLGLAICKMIIEEHGGEIGVESTEGEGSTFWFRLRAL